MRKYFLTIILFTTPAVVFAAPPRNLKGLIKLFIDLINQALVVVVALALLFFFWGLANFILYSDNEEKRKEGKSVMIWGIIALFVMLSVWGIIGILNDTFFGGSGTSAPSIQKNLKIDSDPFDPLKNNIII